MPNTLNTLATAQAIQGILQGVTWSPVISGGSAAYANVFRGEQKDYTNKTPCAVLRLKRGSTERYTTGGQTKDYTHFYIRDYIDFTNAETVQVAEDLMLVARDASLQPFVKEVQLGAVPGIVVAKLVPDSETAGYLPVNKQWYRVREYVIEIAYQYSVIGGFVP